MAWNNGTRAATFLLLASALAWTACQGPAPASPPAAPTTAPAPQAAAPTKPPAVAAAPTAASVPAAAPAPTSAPETIKLGISVPLTGPSARVGTNVERFIRLSIDDVNAKGGIKVGDKTYRFDAVTVDDKGQSESGRDSANRLVLNEKVKFILGSFSAPTAAQQTLTEPSGVMLLTHAATDKSLGPQYPLTLQPSLAHNYMRYAAVYDWLAKTYPNVKRVVSAATDDVTGRALAEVAKNEASKQGMQMVTSEFFPPELKDFNPLVTGILRNSPDALDIFAGSRGPIFLGLMKAFADQGFKGPAVSISADVGALRQGAAFLGNFTWSSMADWKSPTLGAQEKEIIARLAQKYPESELEAWADTAYNILPVLTQAMVKAGTVSDIPKIAKTIRDGEWDTLWSDKWGKSKFVGEKTFGQKGAIEQPIYLSKVQGDQLVTFDVLKATLQ